MAQETCITISPLETPELRYDDNINERRQHYTILATLQYNSTL